MAKSPKIGLALGSGAFRGFAHVGVFKFLEKRGLRIDYLTGSSIGAWAAAHYAIFGSAAKMEEAVISEPGKSLSLLFDFSLTGGLIKGNRVANFLERSLGRRDFSSLATPLKIVTTDLVSGRPFVFSAGDVAKAVRASTSVPLVFKPEKHERYLLVDGALSDPVPAALVRGMGAEVVIGVNLYHPNEFTEKKFTMSKVVLRSTRIALHNLAKVSASDADIIIAPDTSEFADRSGLRKYLDAAMIKKMIKSGEKAAEKAWPEIEKRI